MLSNWIGLKRTKRRSTSQRQVRGHFQVLETRTPLSAAALFGTTGPETHFDDVDGREIGGSSKSAPPYEQHAGEREASFKPFQSWSPQGLQSSGGQLPELSAALPFKTHHSTSGVLVVDFGRSAPLVASATVVISTGARPAEAPSDGIDTAPNKISVVRAAEPSNPQQIAPSFLAASVGMSDAHSAAQLFPSAAAEIASLLETQSSPTLTVQPQPPLAAKATGDAQDSPDGGMIDIAKTPSMKGEPTESDAAESIADLLANLRYLVDRSDVIERALSFEFLRDGSNGRPDGDSSNSETVALWFSIAQADDAGDDVDPTAGNDSTSEGGMVVLTHETFVDPAHAQQLLANDEEMPNTLLEVSLEVDAKYGRYQAMEIATDEVFSTMGASSRIDTFRPKEAAGPDSTRNLNTNDDAQSPSRAVTTLFSLLGASIVVILQQDRNKTDLAEAHDHRIDAEEA